MEGQTCLMKTGSNHQRLRSSITAILLFFDEIEWFIFRNFVAILLIYRLAMAIQGQVEARHIHMNIRGSFGNAESSEN
jgi:hypothetical protein